MRRENQIIRPLYLVAGKHVSIVKPITEEIQYQAYVTQDDDTYEIVVNDKEIERMWRGSFLYKYITLEEYKAAVILHEVAHIRYESWKVKPSFMNELMKYISNVLIDNQIEYSISREFPTYGKYFRWLHAALRKDAISKDLNSKEQGRMVLCMLRAFFDMTRFGIVPPIPEEFHKQTEDFLSFCLPIILSSTRNEIGNVITGAHAVYMYLFNFVTDDEVREAMTNIQIVNYLMSEKDAAGTLAQDALFDTGAREALEDLKQAKTKGRLPGSGVDEIDVMEDESGFFRSTVEKSSAIIRGIREAFTKRLLEYDTMYMYDGDLNLQRQQEAYISSFTHEPSEDYTVLQQVDPSMDVCIIRDISGSTSSMSVPYAEATVQIIAAIHGLRGIRVSEIDFSDGAILNLNFDKMLRTTRLMPRVENSTMLSEALKLAVDLRWGSRKKVCIIITDGGYGDTHELQNPYGVLLKKGVRFKQFDVSGSRYASQTALGEVESITNEELPKVLGNFLLREL